VPGVTIIIKALNEERHIDAAVTSALAAVARADGGEVILADSGSTDGTVEIAARHPITIVQLRNRAERRCGIGPQLGYQRARGAYVYILDGDMEPQALQAMAADPRLAGVGGLVEEASEASYQFRGRKRRGAEALARECEWLDMGGLYRESSLRAVGYFSNRNLHAYEEMDLGLRLRAAGWKLRRIAARSVLHHGRTEGTWGLLARRWRSRYLDGAGELLRAALGRPWFWRAAATQRHLFIALAIWLALVAGVFPWRFNHVVLYAALATLAALVLWRCVRTRHVGDALFGQVVWQVTALAMVRGFIARPRDPRAAVEYVVLKDSSAGA